MKNKMIAGNWKMNKNTWEARAFIQEFSPLVENCREAEIVLCPPFTCLDLMNKLLQGSRIQLGAQNLFWEERGAFTGEISAPMLVETGCRFVIIGHSERRQIMGETDFVINKKLKAALQAGLVPIFCVGETLQERKNDRAREVVKEQLVKGLQDIQIEGRRIVIAYEPVWAIGTGVNASSDDAREMIGFIRSCLTRHFNADTARSVKILYGGSVNKDNITQFLKEEEIDGALVGGASLDAEDFAAMVRLGENAE